MTLSRRIWNVGTVMLLVLFLLGSRLVYWQLVREDLKPPLFKPIRSAGPSDERLVKELDADTLARYEELPVPAQQRAAVLLSNIQRGAIYDRNGRLLAYDVNTEQGPRARFYSEPSLAPLVGYVSSARLGLTGVERAFNEYLLGLDRFDSSLSHLVHQPTVGSDVYLTVDSYVQRAASEALGGRFGSVVVLDGVSGAVLAMVSNPSFDPNRILDEDYVASLLECPSPNCRDALINRATQGLYTPGSIWKTVTLITALDSGHVTPQTVFEFGEPRRGPDGIYYVYEVDGATIIDPNHDEARLNLVQSYRASANAAFARMGDEMPPHTLVDYATRLGFGQAAGEPPLEIDTSPTQLAGNLQELLTNNVLQAATGFGQGELLVSPLSMALMVSAVVNQGDIPVPHLLQRVLTPSGDVRQETEIEYWREDVMRPQTAQQVVDMMITAAPNNSKVSGMTVGGKTGTAQLGGDAEPHAWFVGFAHDGRRTVVIAVIVENAGSGAQVAAPIFARVADAALRHLGEPVEELVPAP